ncbi:hypothetical protein DLJ53_34415 [Acuticoccus sediminis]|uniref:Uncharacterized protein n=1 Tax=Acuticoccus sediminis TaxID=2184697 RepID=A0A8B2NC48_9HYPH|nr:hypothetical protein [Acuticoccus sediminis]RAH95330.1 hypothetical protein DLJ53_34415 [Acuticoccus sediminis]
MIELVAIDPSTKRAADGEAAASPDATLAVWTALELMSSQTFRRDEDVAGGDRSLVGDFRNGLPCEKPVDRLSLIGHSLLDSKAYHRCPLERGRIRVSEVLPKNRTGL